MSFRTIVMLGGKTATGLVIPAEIVDGLGAGKKPAVHVTVEGHTYRSTVASRSGVYLIPLSAEHREAAGVAAGDEVEVDLVLDTEPREVAVPPDLAAALDSDPAAKRAFDGLSYSRRNGHVQSIESAKTADTRQRRVDKAIAALREDRG